MKPQRVAASPIRVTKLLLVGFGLCAASSFLPALGQTRPPYETKLYRPQSSSLEKNYGLPSFGMPGSELPKQRTMATRGQAPAEPDFLSALGAKSKNDDERDAFAAPTNGLETPDKTTPDITDMSEAAPKGTGEQ